MEIAGNMVENLQIYLWSTKMNKEFERLTSMEVILVIQLRNSG
jgi:hypothetical protein